MEIWVLLLNTLLLTGSISSGTQPGIYNIIDSSASRGNQNKDTYIFGGTIARPGEASYHVAVLVGNQAGCGGSILSEKWVITAAHCLRGISPRQVQILVGTNKLSEGGQKYDVEKCILHEESEDNDVALIKVANSIVFNDLVKPIGHAQVSPPDGALLTVTGWGLTEWSPEELPDDLYILNVTKINKDDCKSKILPGFEPGPNQLCTFNKVNEGMCFGDSGGPLIYNNELVALVNHGVPCATGYPDVQADLAIYYKWIQEKMFQID